jgi:Tol biopolymer transport system component
VAPSPDSPTAEPSVATTATPAASPTTQTSVAPSAASDPVLGEGEIWIAYQPSLGIRLVRPGGTGDHSVFANVPGGSGLHPDWSPDGSQIVFTMRGETDEIWIGDADGENVRKIVACQAPCGWADEPAWSPDGTSIVYHRGVDKDGVTVSTIEVIDLADRTTTVVATAPKGRGFYAPRWSPDGSRVVTEFVEYASPAFASEVVSDALAIVDLTAKKPTPKEITSVADRCNNPDWSWVTDLILCSKPVLTTTFDGPADLYTIRPDGSRFEPLTDIGASGGQPIMASWFPDGSAAIFNDPIGNLRVVKADGSGIAPAIADPLVRGLHARVRPTP